MSLITLTLQQGFSTWWFSGEFKEKKQPPCEERYANFVRQILSNGKAMTTDDLMVATGYSKTQVNKAIDQLKKSDELSYVRRHNGKNTYYKVWSLK